MKIRIPRQFAPLTYGVIQSGITAAVATAIATSQAGPQGQAALRLWFTSWSLSWLAMLPVVILVSPIIQRLVVALTTQD